MKITGIRLEDGDLTRLFEDADAIAEIEFGYAGFNKEKINKFDEDNKDLIFGERLEKWLKDGNEVYIDLNNCGQGDEEWDDDLYGVFNYGDAEYGMQDALNNEDVRYDVIDFINGDDDENTGFNLLQLIGLGDIIVG